MRHIMHLDKSPFERIKNGKKKIEGRLNDKKRQKIKMGDEIIFILRGTNEKLKVKVINLKKYKNFGEMFDKTDINLWATDINTNKKFAKSFSYYSDEEIKNLGTVAIYFKLL